MYSDNAVVDCSGTKVFNKKYKCIMWLFIVESALGEN